ncbi:MAG: 2Fe-2S iron-sulfur cluster-binding protein [Pyrinomonadaceae bacterium]
MLKFILNNEAISTEQPLGTTVLDFVRYHKNLKGTKIGCREGDCGACTVLVGELTDGEVNYRTMTSCLMPLANASVKHIVTVEGINPSKRGLTPVQQAMVDASGTQCGFCTVGFVMSLTGFCVDKSPKTSEMAVSAIDGNICRCTGYKSIERAAVSICETVANGSETLALAGGLNTAIELAVVPRYFKDIAQRLYNLSCSNDTDTQTSDHQLTQALLTRPYVSGGTDVYVQRPEAMADSEAAHLFYQDDLRGVRDIGEYIEMGASTTVTDLLVSPIMRSIFPDLYKHLKLISSTPIRNMATLAGNFVNASPIGDMTVWFLSLDAEIDLTGTQAPLPATPQSGVEQRRTIPLRDLYLGYKQLSKSENEYISAIRFRKPTGDFHFNFEKVCKRTYLDIATVNTAISLTVKSTLAEDWVPPALRESAVDEPLKVDYTIIDAHVAAGGVAPVPLYLDQTSEYLRGKQITSETIAGATAIMQSEIAPISDVRGTEAYKRLLLRQLFTAHFVEMFDLAGA